MPSTVITITGIPYDQTEEQVLDIARSVGPVVSSKLLFDKETGKSKGVCLVEYRDSETAQSAVRNLNNYAISGNRFIKCHFTTQDAIVRLLQGDGPNDGSAASRRRNLEKEIPPLPYGVDVTDTSIEGLNAAIYGQLASLGTQRLRNLVTDAQKMSKERPELMALLLERNPQLEYALVQAAMLLDLATPEQIQKLMNAKVAAPAADAPANLSPDEQAAVDAICSMTEDQIRSQIADPQQQELYLEIKRKYA